MPSLPELVIIDLLNTIVERVKQTRPARSDGKPLSGGLVYSQLVLGMPIDPRDYAHAWSPMGGATSGDQQQHAGVPPPPGTPDPVFARSMEAAFKTSQLCNIMLQVTDDGSYQQYPVGRHLAFQYKGIVDAMTPLPVPPPPPDVQQALHDAMKVLYKMDMTDPANPVIEGPKSPLYKKYTKNAMAYAIAKADYARAMAATLKDPAQANIWPQVSAPYQAAVDDAWDTWKTEGADEVERALAVYESQGKNMQQEQIAKARSQFDIWSLGLAGVPTNIPYSYIEPTEWCDPTVDDIGFEQLTIKRTSQDHATSAVSDATHSMYWNNRQSGTTQSSHVGFAMYSVSENSSNADQHAANGDASAYSFQSAGSDSFSDLEIDLEWALVSIYRPWLISDLFYMNNWFMSGARENTVSDGNIETQIKTSHLLPMIPQQMLVVRNVSISSATWGDNKATLTQMYGGDQGSTNASQTSVGGGGGFALGPISAGGGGQHFENKASGQGSGFAAGNALTSGHAEFDGTTLKINGAQVIAFLSDIVPPSPSIPDPSLPKPKARPASGGDGPTGASSPQPPPSTPVPG